MWLSDFFCSLFTKGAARGKDRSSSFEKMLNSLEDARYHNLIFDPELSEVCFEVDFNAERPSDAALLAARQAVTRDLARFLEELQMGRLLNGPGMESNENVIYGQAGSLWVVLKTQPSGTLRIQFNNVESSVMRFMFPRYARRFGNALRASASTSRRGIRLKNHVA